MKAINVITETSTASSPEVRLTVYVSSSSLTYRNSCSTTITEATTSASSGSQRASTTKVESTTMFISLSRMPSTTSWSQTGHPKTKVHSLSVQMAKPLWSPFEKTTKNRERQDCCDHSVHAQRIVQPMHSFVCVAAPYLNNSIHLSSKSM